MVVKNANQDTTFSVTDTTLYVSVVTLSTQDNPNLLEQSKSAFKITTNRNKYQSKLSRGKQNQYLDYLADLSLLGANIHFCVTIWRWSTTNNLETILSSSCRNKR